MIAFNCFDIPYGSTSQIIHVFFSTSAALTAAKTGLAYNTASFAARYVTPGGTISASLTLEDITTLGTYQAPSNNTSLRFKEVDATNMPGVYEIHLHNDWFAGAYRWMSLEMFGASGTAPNPIRFRIPRMNDYDGQRAGLTALPAADANTAGGLASMVVATGTAQAGATQTVTLGAGDSSVTDIYMGTVIYVASGTGAGQTRVVVGYNGTTKVATVDQPWQTVPDNTSVYRLFNLRVPPMDGSLGVIVQAIESAAIASIWGYPTAALVAAGSIGKYLFDQIEAVNGTDAVETGYNVPEALRIMLAVLAGNASGGGSSTNYFRDINNTKDRINASVDANGNRTLTMIDKT